VPRLGWIPRIVGIACVEVCLVGTGCGVLAAQQSQQAGEVNKPKTVLRGTVINSVTHEPVGRAVVQASDGRFATMTNDRGQFEMVFKLRKAAAVAVNPGAQDGGRRSVDTGNATTSSSGPGAGVSADATVVDRPTYLMARRTGFLSSIPQGSPGFAIAPDQEEVTISLVPEARVVGRVTLADGEGARGMQVAIYKRTVQSGRAQWQPAGAAEVKSDGEFRMADLVEGEYKLFSLELNDRDPVNSTPRGQQFGYPPDYYPGAKDFGSGALIHLAAGETFQATLTPEERRYYPVHIGVVNRQQGEVPQVEVWKDGRPGPGYSLGFDFRNGSIGGSLPDGNYLVKVTSQNESGLTGVTNLSVNGGPANGMVTLMGGTVVNVQLTEEFGNSEQAQQIREAESRIPQSGGDSPVPQRRLHRGGYIQFMLWSVEEFSFRRQLMAQPPGDPEAEGLEIQNVPAGEYRVQVQTPVGYVASIRSGGTDLQTSHLVVAAGTTMPPIEVVLRDDGGGIDGTVTDVANRNRTSSAATSGVAAGFVYVVPQDNSGEMKEAVVQANGDFGMVQLAPGTYRVFAFELPGSNPEYSNEDALKKYDAQTITLAPGQKEKIRISFSKE
jgi:hypothetical protein